MYNSNSSKVKYHFYSTYKSTYHSLDAAHTTAFYVATILKAISN